MQSHWRRLRRSLSTFLLVAAPGGLLAQEGSGEPLPAAELARRIDLEIRKVWEIDQLTPAPISSDAEFFRRLHLDLTGTIPSAQEAEEFAADSSPGKRARAIERLLDSPAFARHFSTVITNWAIPRQPRNRVTTREPFRAWVESALAGKRGWDRIVRDLIIASGAPEEAPATTFLLANGPTPPALAGETSRLFLGVQIQCAQCHDHPFTSWKREDFWSLAAFFSQVRRQRGSKQNTFVITDAPGGARGAPQRKGNKGGRPQPPARPIIQIPDTPERAEGKFLDGGKPEIQPGQSFREPLAEWIASKDNPFFARAMVNRVWGYLFGRGFFNPIDDFQPDSDVSHPDLLDLLSGEFAASGFDLRHLLRAVAGSEAYQLSSRTGGEAAPEAARENAVADFAVRTLRALSPEQLFDSLARATGTEAEADEETPKRRPQNQRGQAANTRDRVVALMATAENPDDPQSFEGSIPVTLFLMNGPIINRRIPSLERLAAGEPAPGKLVDSLFLTALSRRPDAEEREHTVDYITRSGDRKAAARSLFWSLLNSSEFALNH